MPVHWHVGIAPAGNIACIMSSMCSPAGQCGGLSTVLAFRQLQKTEVSSTALCSPSPSSLPVLNLAAGKRRVGALQLLGSRAAWKYWFLLFASLLLNLGVEGWGRERVNCSSNHALSWGAETMLLHFLWIHPNTKFLLFLSPLLFCCYHTVLYGMENQIVMEGFDNSTVWIIYNNCLTFWGTEDVLYFSLMIKSLKNIKKMSFQWSTLKSG